MTMYQLNFIAGERKGEVQVLPEGATALLGRSRSASLRFLSPDISGKHLELTPLPSGDLAMKNLSAHRTEVNGQALAEGEAVILGPGDRVLFGETNSFVLEQAGEVAVNGGDAAEDEVTCATNFEPSPEALIPVVVASAQTTAHTVPPVSSDEAKTEIPEEDTPCEVEEEVADEVTVVDALVLPQNDRTEIPEPVPEEKPPSPPITATPYVKKAPPSPPVEEDEERETSKMDEEDIDNETMIMQTRVATMEEMEILRKTRKPKMPKWVVYLAAGLIVSATLVAISYVISQTNIENPLTWPMDGDKYNDEVIAPDIGVEKDFIIYFPKHRSMKVVKEPNRIMAMTRLGKHRDVPCRVIFHMNKSVENLSMNRGKGFKAWQDKMMAAGGQWNFDVDPNVHFRGKEHGFPYQMARYTRSVDKEAWFGVVMYMKDRDWELILQKEIPSSERYRGELLLVDTPFMSVAFRYVMNHWEPGDVTFDMPVQEMMNEAKLMLNRAVPTPRMWPHILDLIRNVMVISLRENDMATYSTAMDLLRDLRTKQSQWLNNQKISYFAAQAKNLTKLAATIRQDCLTVFSDEDDFRCHQLRNDQWD